MEWEFICAQGGEDLTSDVNFLDLTRWGEQLGLETVQLSTQGEFIRKWANPLSAGQQLADRYISDESGMGEALKVLHQRKASIERTGHGRQKKG